VEPWHKVAVERTTVALKDMCHDVVSHQSTCFEDGIFAVVTSRWPLVSKTSTHESTQLVPWRHSRTTLDACVHADIHTPTNARSFHR